MFFMPSLSHYIMKMKSRCSICGEVMDMDEDKKHRDEMAHHKFSVIYIEEK